MKSDTDLRRDILDELEMEPSIDASQIGVAVKDGIVTLTGTTPSFYEKREAENAARRVSGVKAVAEEIAVHLPSSSERSDSEIAQSAVNALSNNISVPYDRIKVTVENGWVTLEGDVDWRYQVTDAENAMRRLMGVMGITNVIDVRPRVKATNVKAKIEEELKRDAGVDALHIQVETHEGTVELKGTVRSWYEREEAERAAWAVPGVRVVDDHLTIQPYSA